MPEITSRTLVLAIQAIDGEIRALREVFASGDASPDECELLLQLTLAAEDLERAYTVAAIKQINLTSYDELVNRSP